jgi:hypothetical protein
MSAAKNENLTHLCLISGQPLANLLPLRVEQPARAIFLVSPEMEQQATRLAKVASRYGVAVSMHKIDSAYDYENVQDVCAELIGINNGNLTLNITGGTKIAALAAFLAFFSADGQPRIIYCDTEHEQILQLEPANTRTRLAGNLISVADYLTSYGLPPTNSGKPPAAFKGRAGQLAALATLLIQEENLLARLNSAIAAAGRKPFINISLNSLGPKGENLARILEKCQVCGRGDGVNINIPNQKAIFFCKGGWLEEYVYRAVLALAVDDLDLAMNVKVRWDGAGKKQTTNEFDILFTHNNRLHVISCKAANPERVTATGSRATEALNELDTLADRAGGIFGRAMLVSARKLSDFDRVRAEKMRIKLVDGQDVLQLAEHLRSWLKL